MPTLADQIEQLRLSLNNVAPHEEQLIQDLAVEIAATDERLIAMLDTIMAEHQSRRGAVRERLETLASRMGFLPNRAGAPPPIDERFNRRGLEARAAELDFASPTYPPDGLFRPVNSQPLN